MVAQIILDSLPRFLVGGDELFKEHENIILTDAVLGDQNIELKAGDVGAIIHIHPGCEAFVVEFMTPNGETVEIATVLASQVRPVTESDITHTRILQTVI